MEVGSQDARAVVLQRTTPRLVCLREEIAVVAEVGAQFVLKLLVIFQISLLIRILSLTRSKVSPSLWVTRIF